MMRIRTILQLQREGRDITAGHHLVLHSGRYNWVSGRHQIQQYIVSDGSPNASGWATGFKSSEKAEEGMIISGGGIIDPMLGPLDNNGGPTQTHALLSDSPAIDKGSENPTEKRYDQRGNRVKGADIKRTQLNVFDACSEQGFRRLFTGFRNALGTNRAVVLIFNLKLVGIQLPVNSIFLDAYLQIIRIRRLNSPNQVTDIVLKTVRGYLQARLA